MQKTIFLSLLGACVISKLSTAPYFYRSDRPIIVSHRGASGEFPEHSLGAFTSAYTYGTDFLELDVQVTKDNHLVVNHDATLSQTFQTDQIDALFSDRKRMDFQFGSTYIDGDYLIHDFTLAELKMFRRKQRDSHRNQFLNGVYSIYTVEEAIETLLHLNENFPRAASEFPVGLYIEPKDYLGYKTIFGLDLLDMLHQTLAKYDLETVEKSMNKAPVIIQSFEFYALIRYASFSDLPLVYLLGGGAQGKQDFDMISKYVHGVGPSLSYITSYLEEEYNKDAPSAFMELAHSYDLAVHPYELRDDHLSVESTILEEHYVFINKGVDGIFTEFPHTTYAAFTYFPYPNTFPFEE